MQDGSLSNVLNAIYKQSPQSFTEEEVDYLSSLSPFSKSGPIQRSKEEQDFNLFNSIGQLVNGFVTGFTTIDVGDAPKNAYEEVARSLGHLAGFVGYIPGAGTLGKASGMMLGKVAKESIPFLSKAAGLAEGFKITSLPMAGANAITKGFSKYGGEKAIGMATEHLLNAGVSQGALTMGKDIIGGGLHLGIASAISAAPSIPVVAWESNIDERMTALGEGFLAGGVFRTIGNIFPSKGMELGASLSSKIKDPNGMARILAANLYMGLPSTLADDPWQLQVYQYVSGAYFGLNEISANQRKAIDILGKAYKREATPDTPTQMFATAQAHQNLIFPEKLPGYAEATPEVQSIVREQANFRVGKITNGLTDATIAEYVGFQEGLKEAFETGKITAQTYLESFMKTEIAKNHLEEIEKSGKDPDTLTYDEMQGILDNTRAKTAETLTKEMEVAKIDFLANNLPDQAVLESNIKLDTYSEQQRVTFSQNAALMFDKGIGRFSDPINTFAEKLSGGEVDKGLEIQKRLIDVTIEAKNAKDFDILTSKISEEFKIPISYEGEGRENWNLLRRAWNSSLSKPIQQGTFNPLTGKFDLLGTKDSKGKFIGIASYPSAITERLEAYSKEKNSEKLNLFEQPQKFVRNEQSKLTPEDKVGPIINPKDIDFTAVGREDFPSEQVTKVQLLQTLGRGRDGRLYAEVFIVGKDIPGGKWTVALKEPNSEPLQEVSMRFVQNKDGENVETLKWLTEAIRSGEVKSVDDFTTDMIEKLDAQGYFYRGGQKAKSFAGAIKQIVTDGAEVEKVIARAEALGFKRPENATPALLRNIANNMVLYSEVMNNKPIEEIFANKDKYINNVAELNKRFQLWEDTSVPVDGKLISKLLNKEVSDVVQEVQGQQEEVDYSTFKVVELRAKAKELGIKGISKFKKAELIEALSKVSQPTKVAGASLSGGKNVVLASIPEDGSIEGFSGWGEYSKVLAKAGYDGLKFVREDLFDAHTIAGGLDAGIGAIKSVTTHTDGNGQLLLKLADFRATKEMSDAMRKAGIDELVFSTGVKQLGSRELAKVSWGKDGLKVQGATYNLPYETTKINYSSSEHLESALKRQNLDTDFLTTPTKSEGFGDVIDRQYSKEFRSVPLYGDPLSNKLLGSYKTAKGKGSDATSLAAIASEIRIEQLSNQDILNVFQGKDVHDHPLFRKLASDLLKESTELEDMRTDLDEVRTPETELDFATQTEYISAAKRKLQVAKEITPILLNDKDVRPYFNTLLDNFIKKRTLTPKVPYSTKNVFAPAPFELLSKMGNEWSLHPEWVFLGEGMRKEKIPWLGGKEITIEKAMEEYWKNPKNEEMKDKLSWVLGRTPKYHVSGMQVVLPRGFSGISGTSIVLHPTMLMRQSGADLDIDSGKLYRNVDRSFKEALWKNRETFVTDKGKFLAPDIEDSPFVISNTGKDKDFWKMFDPKSLMLNATNSYTGNNLLGIGINASKNIRVMYDMAKRSGRINGRLGYAEQVKFLKHLIDTKESGLYKKFSPEQIAQVEEFNKIIEKGDSVNKDDLKALIKGVFGAEDIYISRKPKASSEEFVTRTYDLIDKAADATGGVTMVDRNEVPKILLDSAFENMNLEFVNGDKKTVMRLQGSKFKESPYSYFDFASLSNLNKVYKGRDRDGKKYGLQEAVEVVKKEAPYLKRVPNLFFQGVMSLENLKVDSNPLAFMDTKKWQETRGYFDNVLRHDKAMRSLLKDMGIQSFGLKTKWPVGELRKVEASEGKYVRQQMEADFVDNDSSIYESLLVLRRLANEGLSRTKIKEISNEALKLKDGWRRMREGEKMDKVKTETDVRDYKLSLENDLERDFFDAVLMSPFYKQEGQAKDIETSFAKRIAEAETVDEKKALGLSRKIQLSRWWETRVDNQAFTLASLSERPLRMLLAARKQIMERVAKGLSEKEVNDIVRYADPNFVYEPKKDMPYEMKEEPIAIRKEETWLDEHIKLNNQIRAMKPELSPELREFANTVKQFVTKYPQVIDSFGEQITGAMMKTYGGTVAPSASFLTLPDARSLNKTMKTLLGQDKVDTGLPGNAWRQFTERIIQSPMALAKDFGYYEIEETPVVTEKGIQMRPVKVWSWTGEKVFNIISSFHELAQGRTDANDAMLEEDIIYKMFKQSPETQELFSIALAQREINLSSGQDEFAKEYDKIYPIYKNKYENGNKKIKVLTESGSEYKRAKDIIREYNNWMTQKAKDNDISRIRNFELEKKYLDPFKYDGKYYDLQKVQDTILKAIENGTIEKAESLQMMARIRWQAALDNLQISGSQIDYLIKGTKMFEPMRGMSKEEFRKTIDENPEFLRYKANPTLYTQRNQEMGRLFGLYEATNEGKTLKVSDIADLGQRAELLNNMARMPQYRDLFDYDGIALLGNAKNESDIEQTKHELYFPHNSNDKLAVEEKLTSMMEEMKASNASEVDILTKRLEAQEQYANGQDILSTLSVNETEAINQLYTREWTESELHNLKVTKPMGLMHRGEIMPGWLRSPEAYKVYERQLIDNYWKQLSAFAVSEEIRRFEANKPMGENTKYWSMWLWDFARRSYGKPSYFAKEYLDDKGYKLKNSLYYAFSDQVWEKILTKVEKTKMGGKLFDTGVYGELLKVQLNLANQGNFGKDIYWQQRYEKANDATKPVIIEEYKNSLRESLVARQRMARSRALQWFSNIEAKAQMLTLLTHTKTIATNLATGHANTVVSAGFKSWWQAGDFKYLKDKVFTGWTGKDDYEALVKRHGVIEQMLQYEGGFRNIQITSNVKKFIGEALEEINKNGYNVKKLKSISERNGVGKSTFDLAAAFMRVPEMALRKRAWMAHYLNAKDMLNASDDIIPNEHPWLIKMANKGVASSQFLYNNIHRPAFASTAMGKVFSRFQLWAWNSVKFRTEAFRQAKEMGFDQNSAEFTKLKRMLTADMFIIALAKLYPMSIFDTGTPPPYTYFQDLGDFFFGDEKERDRAFFGTMPWPANILQMVTPPLGRYTITPLVTALTGDWDKFANYTAWTYAPFGRLARDTWKTLDNPRRIMENYTGLPINKFGGIKQELQKHDADRNRVVQSVMSRVLFGK